MQDADPLSKTSQSLSLSQWLYQAICAGEPERAAGKFRLRLRLRGNYLHVLCEGTPLPVADRVVPRFIRALRSPEAAHFDLLSGKTDEPVYKVVLYGRTAGQSQPAWIEPLDLKTLRSVPAPPVVPPTPPAPVTAAGAPAGVSRRTATLAAPVVPAPPAQRESPSSPDSPDAIARYLSESLAPLGVSVRVLVQKLPQADAGETGESKRLWVVCSCAYSPDASLIAQPLARQLRELQLEGFKEAAIRLQVSGETTPDWVLQVDLTSPQAMLRHWARWGDVEALERLLNRVLRERGVRIRATAIDGTLHLFCSLRLALGLPQEVPAQSLTIAAIARVLDGIAPQGLAAAAVYGVRSLELEVETLAPDALKEAPVWVQWLNLPAGSQSERALPAIALARQLDLAALSFLLQRLLNPNLDERMTTGGIGVKLCVKDSLLHVMTEALVCPPQVQVVSRIEKLLRRLELPDLQGARLYGRRAGQAAPLWSYAIELVPPPVKTVEVVPEEAAAPAAPPTLEPAPAEPSPATAAAGSGSVVPPRSVRQQLQQLLCWTRVFVPTAAAGNPARLPRPSLSRWADERDLRIAVLWAVFGVLLAVQLDWMLGRALRATAEQPEAVMVAQSEAWDEAAAARSRQPEGVSDGDRLVTTLPDRRESEAAAAAILAAARSQNPSFNNTLLDEKLALYQERLREHGPPDVLIVGSSRAMRGVDPLVLQRSISAQGYQQVEIFNFGINGATAQIVDLILRRLLTPEQLPELVIWADGARAFNSGRPDLTYEAIADSPGYQRLEAGTFPGQGRTERTRRPPLTARLAQGFRAGYTDFNRWLSDAVGYLSAIYPQRSALRTWLHARWLEPLPGVDAAAAATATEVEREPIDLDGFLAIATRFNPETYYRAHARVSGAYDSDYDSFSLRGRQYQALRQVRDYLREQRVELVFVNLPLTDEYLDPVRREHEVAFAEHMETVDDLVFRDLAEHWPTEHEYFSDPSHLNRYGAYEVSQQLARDPAIPWEASTD